MSPDELIKQFDEYLHEAHRLKVLYAPQITLLIGLETEFVMNPDLDHLDALLDAYGDRVQYLVGSIHHVNGIPIDFDLPTYHKALHTFGSESEHEQQASFLAAYFDAQYQLLRRFHPEVIGHFDLCRLYDPDIRFEEFPEIWALVERNVLYAIGYGALFEVNAAAFRKGWTTAYPASDVLEV